MAGTQERRVRQCRPGARPRPGRRPPCRPPAAMAVPGTAGADRRARHQRCDQRARHAAWTSQHPAMMPEGLHREIARCRCIGSPFQRGVSMHRQVSEMLQRAYRPYPSLPELLGAFVKELSQHKVMRVAKCGCVVRWQGRLRGCQLRPGKRFPCSGFPSAMAARCWVSCTWKARRAGWMAVPWRWGAVCPALRASDQALRSQGLGRTGIEPAAVAGRRARR